MEGCIAADLYGEALQQSSMESCQISAAEYVLNDAHDNSADGWFNVDGSPCELESERICNHFVSVGYREGLIAGQEASAQNGFNIGFKQSVSTGYNFGIVRGITRALSCLPDQLNESLVGTEEKRNKLKQLHESVRSISKLDTVNFFIFFIEEKIRKDEMNRSDCTRIADEGVLENYCDELQSFVSETLAIKSCLGMVKL